MAACVFWCWVLYQENPEFPKKIPAALASVFFHTFLNNNFYMAAVAFICRFHFCRVSFLPLYHKSAPCMHFFVDTGTQVHQYLGYGIASALEIVGLWCIKALWSQNLKEDTHNGNEEKSPRKKSSQEKKEIMDRGAMSPQHQGK